MVVADECKIQREPNPFYRWNTKGVTPVVKVDRKRGGYSFYGGLSLKTKSQIAYITKENQTAKETCKFLDEIKKSIRPVGWRRTQRLQKPKRVPGRGLARSTSCGSSSVLFSFVKEPAYSE